MDGAMNRRALFVLCAAAALPRAAAAMSPMSPVATLTALIRERIAVAPGVAKSKWNTKGSIEDLEREKQLIDLFVKEAPARGIDAAFASRVIRVQIEASKVVQAGLFARWTAEKHAPFTDAPDLRADIRPTLDRLTPLFLAVLEPAIAELTANGPGLLVEQIKDADPLTAAALSVATAPLLELAR